MCNLINGILLVACTLSIVASRSVENDGPAQFFRQNVAFGEDLYSSVQQGRDGKNLLVSPFSVQTAFAMVFFGATGKTAEEIATGLKLVSNDRQTVASLTESVIEAQLNNPIINIANKIYVTSDLKIKPAFKDVVTKSFFSDVENIDFTNTEESASVINSWVDTKTNHMIPQVVSSSDLEDLELLLVNTVHFKGEWQYKFEKVQKEKFYYAKDKSVETNMMSANAPFKVPYGGFDKFAAVQLPFKNSSFSMLIILPNSDEDIQQVEQRIKTLSIAEFKQQMWSEKVNVQIPKFKAEFSTELSENLKQLGIKRAFNGAEAELFDIASNDHDVSTVIRPSTSRLVVSKVIHKTAIEVNEVGAEAAAVTGVGGHHFNLPSLGPSEPIEFKADRSFIYSIMDKNAIYFVGRYTAEEKQ